MYRSYLDSKGDAAIQSQIALLLMWSVGRHAIMEEVILHPLLHQAIETEGSQLAEMDAAEHYVRRGTKL